MKPPASNNQGYVYVLTNPAMPGLVKIGRSRTAAAGRANTMYRGDTGVPLPFEIAFECLFDDCISGEQAVHDYLEHCRINPNREFFRVFDGDAVIAVLDCRAMEIDHRVSHGDVVVDESVYHFLSHEMGCLFPEVRESFEEITADELYPALNRVRERNGKNTTEAIN
jgi:hypothetical protein